MEQNNGFSQADEQYMRRALALAEKGIYTTSPNPNVGCVLVKNGQIIGEGYHKKQGEPHAEVNALRDCKESPQGATAYVTLEPCSHFGSTPPCCDALINAGVKRVVVGAIDPNPKVSGQGVERLRECGIEVETGLLADESEELNRGFMHRMRTGRPYVQLKMGMSIDGKTATATGESKWITNENSRKQVQAYRAQADAILSASGTILVDNPELNVRWHQLPRSVQDVYPAESLKNPIRVIMDSQHRVKPYHRLFSINSPVWLVGDKLKPRNLDGFPNFVESVYLSNSYDSLPELMQRLGSLQINTVWIEAGANLVGSLLSAHLVDELIVYIAPMLLGDQAIGLCHLPFVRQLADAPRWQLKSCEMIDGDIKLIYKPKKHSE